MFDDKVHGVSERVTGGQYLKDSQRSAVTELQCSYWQEKVKMGIQRQVGENHQPVALEYPFLT